MKPIDITKINNYLNNLEKSPRSLAIFDLDSTLYNVSPRTQQIVQDFCTDAEVISKYPEEAMRLSSITIESHDWGYLEALDRHDFTSSVRFLKSLAKFWRKKFFSNDYMDHDTPYTNAAKFVNSIPPLNCELLYLTGRARNKMLTGSIKNLKRDQFPLPDENSLIMKTNPDLLDHVFKSTFINEIKSEYDQIILFENEPKILNRVRKDHPEVMMCFINSTHSRAESLTTEIPTIHMDYSSLVLDK